MPPIPGQPRILSGDVQKMVNTVCPVCGYSMEQSPSDYNICPSCGTEFGYDDLAQTFEELRREWWNAGPKWWSPVDTQPPDWDPARQVLSGIWLSHLVDSTVPIPSGQLLSQAHALPEHLTGAFYHPQIKRPFRIKRRVAKINPPVAGAQSQVLSTFVGLK